MEGPCSRLSIGVALAVSYSAGRDVVQVEHPAEHVRTANRRRLRVGDRVDGGGSGRDAGERCHLREAQLVQRLAEVDLRGCRHAIGALTEEDLVHVEREDLLLGEFRLHQQRDIDLAHLALHVPMRRQEHVARHLHGDGARALADPSGPGVGEGRPQNPFPINAMVAEKAVVLGGQERLNELRGQLVVAHRDASLFPDRGDQPSVAGIHPEWDLELDLPQTVDIGQGGLQVDISADIGEGNQHDRRHQDHTNARYENQVTFGHRKPF